MKGYLLLMWERIWQSVFLLLIFGGGFQSNAQLSSTYTYSYVGTNANAYNATPTILQATGSVGNDAVFASQNIGFTFKFNCVDYTTVGISANGFVWFGTGTCATNQYTPLSSVTGETGTVAGIISAFGANLVPGGASGTRTLSTKLTGAAPNRVFTIEWRKTAVTGITTNPFDAQIKLFETSNDVEIRLYDSPYLISGSNAVGQVGMRAGLTDFVNRTTSGVNLCTTTAGAVNSATCSIVPTTSCNYATSASGQSITYRYTFTGPCCTFPTVQPTAGSSSAVSINTATLNWTPGNGSGGDMVFLKAGSPISTDPSNSTTYTANASFGSGTQIGATGAYAVYSGSAGTVNLSNLAPNTTYYYTIYTFTASGPCFLTPSTLTGSFTTLPACVGPTIQPSLLNVSCIGYTTMNLRFTRGNGNRAIVVARAGSPVNAFPSYGVSYTANPNFGSGSQIGVGNFVVYDGNDAGIVTVPLTGLSPATTYYFSIYEYNTPPNCYNTTAPATISGTTRGDGVYTSSNCTQITSNITQGSLAQEVVRLNIVIGGGNDQAIFINSLTFNSTGSTNTATDLTNVKVFYTGSSATFSNATQFGQTFTTFGTNTATGNFALLAGNNYFWIAYDVKLTATAGDVVDAQITQFTLTDEFGLNPQTYSPTPTAPAGSRPIVAAGGTCPITTPSARCSGGGCNTSLSQGEYIANVSLGTTITAPSYPTSSGCAPAVSYTDLTASSLFQVMEGSTYNMSMTMSTWFSVQYNWCVWIDWNGNGDFRDAGERYPSGTATMDEWTTIPVTVPVGVAPGNHAMRVWSQEFSYPPDACPYRTTQGPLTTSLGEIIDLTVVVPNASGVAAPPAGGAVSCATLAPGVVTPIFYTVGDPASPLSATGTGLLWYTSPTGGVGSSTPPTPSTATSGTTTYYVSQTNTSGSPLCEGPRIQIAVVVEPPAGPGAPILTVVQPTCNVATGTINFSGLPASGWVINPDLISGAGTTTSISPVSPGTYTYTVTDAQGCISPPSLPAIVNPQPPGPSAPIIGTVTQPSGGGTTGSVDLSGLPTNSWTVNPDGTTGPAGVTTTTISGLVPGTYTFTVTDGNGCVSAASLPVVISGSLPIELDFFSGSCEGTTVHLYWSTQSEINNDYFVVERMITANDWENRGIVDGAGFSMAELNYSFDDPGVRESSYYRLKQTDFDGNTSLSPVIYVDNCSTSTELVIWPNPSNGIFLLQSPYEEKAILSVEVYNVVGEVVFKTPDLQTAIDLSDKENGVYFIRLNLISSESITEKVILKK